MPNGNGLIAAVTGATALLVLLCTESLFPLRERRCRRARRYVVNLCLSGLGIAAGAWLVTPAALAAMSWTTSRDLGLLSLLPLPPVVRFAAGFLLMDATFYYWHRLNHIVPLLWRFHSVHHVDPDLDVTTSFRFHLVEIAYSAPFRVLQVLFVGAFPLLYVAYGITFQLCTLFHHSNLRLPLWLERLLNRVVVTPRMHGIHHSVVAAETNSNYSVVFRFWDLINGSLRLGVRQSDITIGVAGYSAPSDNGVWTLLAMPFRKQRNYWRFPGGGRPHRDLGYAAPNRLLE